MSSQIERIISLGGGVRVDGSKFMSSQLERFASLAAKSGARVEIFNVGHLMSSQLDRIAAYGNGRVLFDLTI